MNEKNKTAAPRESLTCTPSIERFDPNAGTRLWI